METSRRALTNTMQTQKAGAGPRRLRVPRVKRPQPGRALRNSPDQNPRLLDSPTRGVLHSSNLSPQRESIHSANLTTRLAEAPKFQHSHNDFLRLLSRNAGFVKLVAFSNRCVPRGRFAVSEQPLRHRSVKSRSYRRRARTSSRSFLGGTARPRRPRPRANARTLKTGGHVPETENRTGLLEPRAGDARPRDPTKNTT